MEEPEPESNNPTNLCPEEEEETEKKPMEESFSPQSEEPDQKSSIPEETGDSIAIIAGDVVPKKGGDAGGDLQVRSVEESEQAAAEGRSDLNPVEDKEEVKVAVEESNSEVEGGKANLERSNGVETERALDGEEESEHGVKDNESEKIEPEVGLEEENRDGVVDSKSSMNDAVEKKTELATDDGVDTETAADAAEVVGAKVAMDDVADPKMVVDDAVDTKTAVDDGVGTKAEADAAAVVGAKVAVDNAVGPEMAVDDEVDTNIVVDGGVGKKEADAAAVVGAKVAADDAASHNMAVDDAVDTKTKMAVDDGMGLMMEADDAAVVGAKAAADDAASPKMAVDDEVDTKMAVDDGAGTTMEADANAAVGAKVALDDAAGPTMAIDDVVGPKIAVDDGMGVMMEADDAAVVGAKVAADDAASPKMAVDDADTKMEADDDAVDTKVPLDDKVDAAKVAANKGAKGRKKVPVKATDDIPATEDAEEMEVDMDGPAKAAGKRGAKIRNKVPTKGRAVVMGGEGGEKKVSGSSGTGSGKKRGRSRTSEGGRMKGPSKLKEDEESLCFICFDGGDLVVCDHRGCPKVYHPSCVNRDEAYFAAKGQWSCGWHICSKCEKTARHMCYTCTYSLCKRCINEAEFIHVRGTKGFCEDCMKIVMLIETDKHEDETMDGLDFDDKTSWLYLFKDYWIELKEKLSLTLEELTRARTPLKCSKLVSQHKKPLDNLGDASDDQGGSSSNSPVFCKSSVSSSKKARKRSRKTTNKEDSVKEVEVEGTSSSDDPEWASKELLEFVAHMKDGDISVLTHFEVQTLLLQYIRQNNLRDPRNRGQIKCDSRLFSLFGKSRVGHLEMLKLIESHFLLKETSPLAMDDNQEGVVDPDPSLMEGNSDASTKMALYMRRKSRRKVEEKAAAHLADFAAIDVHNISFLYLRRNLMEELLNENDTFKENVVGCFVRIRISSMGQKQDLYRLVQVVGTGKAAEIYKIGKRSTDITLEILNLDKREYITIDNISNQDFTEEECKRLRQSVKLGLINRPTVGGVQEKAMALQKVKVNDWLESEKLRLGNLRDRASEKGHRKELRECVEKLQLLNTPEERIRRLNEVPDIHADPHMDPDYESAEDEDLYTKKRDVYNRSQGSLLKGRDGLSAARAASASNRSTPNDCHQGNHANPMNFSETSNPEINATMTTGGIPNNNQSSTVPTESTSGSLSSSALLPPTPSETEKMWNYQDPTCKIQGPFSMTQLRKWNTTGFFPANLRIWRSSEKQEDSILLTDALAGKFHKDSAREEPQYRNTPQPTNVPGIMVNNSDDGRRGNTGVVNPADARCAASSTDWESSKEAYVRNGQQQGQGGHRTNAFSRNQSHYPSYQGRDDRGGNTSRWNGGRGRQNNWNSNRPRRFDFNGRDYERHNPYHSSSGQQFSREQQINQPENGFSNQLGNNFVNRTAPVPPPNSIDWTGLQGALNKILPPVQAQQSPVQTNVWPSSSGPPATSIQVQEKVHVPSDQQKSQSDEASGRELDSEKTCPEARDVSIGAPNATGSSSLPVASVPAQISKAAPNSQPQPVLAQPGPSSSGVNPAPPLNAGWGAGSGTGTAQVIGNMVYGPTVQGGANMGWGMMAPGVMNMAWATPGNLNMVWAQPGQNLGLTMPAEARAPTPQGNPNASAGFGAPGQVNPALNSGWVVPMNPNPGWVGPMAGNTNQNVIWGAPVQGAPGNMGAAWNPSGANPNGGNVQP